MNQRISHDQGVSICSSFLLRQQTYLNASTTLTSRKEQVFFDISKAVMGFAKLIADDVSTRVFSTGS